MTTEVRDGQLVAIQAIDDANNSVSDAHDRLYVAVLRYARAFEREHIDSNDAMEGDIEDTAYTANYVEGCVRRLREAEARLARVNATYGQQEGQ
jgi:hypothetical protein